MEKTRVLSINTESLSLAVKALKRGELIGFPTETVYGLAGDATSADAVLKIFKMKNRPSFDPLIVHFHLVLDNEERFWAELEKKQVVLVQALSEKARNRVWSLAKKFWPGPLTLVLPKNINISDLVTAGLQTVAIRMPSHPIALELLKMSELLLAAPSANQFGRISPTSAEDVKKELEGKLSLILDGGRCEIGIESTVLYVHPATAELSVLRPGKISQTEIQACVGEGEEEVFQRKSFSVFGHAPGMLKSHYAPRKKLILLEESLLKLKNWESLQGVNGKKCGILMMSGNAQNAAEVKRRVEQNALSVYCEVFVLSETGNVSEMAQRLFHGLRFLDESAAEILYAEPMDPQELLHNGLLQAIQDRLLKAAGRGIEETI